MPGRESMSMTPLAMGTSPARRDRGRSGAGGRLLEFSKRPILLPVPTPMPLCSESLIRVGLGPAPEPTAHLPFEGFLRLARDRKRVFLGRIESCAHFNGPWNDSARTDFSATSVVMQGPRRGRRRSAQPGGSMPVMARARNEMAYLVSKAGVSPSLDLPLRPPLS